MPRAKDRSLWKGRPQATAFKLSDPARECHTCRLPTVPEVMLTFLTANANLPFTIALCVMLILLLIEIVSLAFGAAASGLFDSVLPDFDSGDAGGSELHPGSHRDAG